MKFLPVKEGNMAMLMRLPVRRLSLKAYIEKSMIPDIIEHEGSEFLSSLFWGAQPFVCDLYNGVWEQYAQERPFNHAARQAVGVRAGRSESGRSEH